MSDSDNESLTDNEKLQDAEDTTHDLQHELEKLQLDMEQVKQEKSKNPTAETLKKELPYCCEVRIEEFKEAQPDDPKPINRIKATVFVERESQKLIVIGKGGVQIKAVGTMARKKIEDFLQEKVFLELKVKVNKDWRKSEDLLKEFGYMNR